MEVVIRKSNILSTKKLKPKTLVHVGEIKESDMNIAIGVGVGILAIGTIATIFLYRSVGWIPALIVGAGTVAVAVKVAPAVI